VQFSLLLTVFLVSLNWFSLLIDRRINIRISNVLGYHAIVGRVPINFILDYVIKVFLSPLTVSMKYSIVVTSSLLQLYLAGITSGNGFMPICKFVMYNWVGKC
jgi:hypothetical protein